MKWIVLRIVLATLAIVVLLAAGWVWLTLHWAYSDGERTGYIQKLSHKGWVCKTWEGEIVLVTMPGAIPEKFEFTVRDELMADKINAAAGKRVVLHYEQHKFIPSSCFGDTEYFVDDIREPSDVPAANTPATSAPASSLPPPSAQQGKLQPPR